MCVTTVTPQQISDFDESLRLDREKLTMFTHPLNTLFIFSMATCSITIECFKYSVSHPVFLYILVPTGIMWRSSKFIDGPHGDLVRQAEFAIEFFVWWVGLGILSSIGLGSGLQSGVLFLFPHIIKTCLTAQTCKTLDFVSSSNIWFRSPPNLFKCPELTYESTPVTFFGLWTKLFLACFLQAAGTAIGEIPPFYMTRAARLAAISAAGGNENDDDDHIPEELESNSNWVWINKLKSWLIKFLRTHGFYGILIMASFPNIAFDLCGICCGHYLMPFWTFFLATFVGKAIIRNFYQSLIYVMLCQEEYMKMFIELLQYLTPDSFQVDEAIRDVLEEGRASFQQNQDGIVKQSENNEPSLAANIMFYWQLFMAILLLSFAASCISQFAQYYQMTLDHEESNKLRALLPPSVQEQLRSPNGSGRLILPPPTPKRIISTETINEEEREEEEKIQLSKFNSEPQESAWKVGGGSQNSKSTSIKNQ